MKKAECTGDLIDSINSGAFRKDGSHLNPAFFNVSYRGLKSLIGSPKVVNGSGHFHGNRLTSLEGCPEIVRDNLSLEGNNFTDLHDIHKHVKYIGWNLLLIDNPLRSHILGVLKIESLRCVQMDNEQVEKIINKYLLGSRDILDCAEELVEAGYSEYAQL